MTANVIVIVVLAVALAAAIAAWHMTLHRLRAERTNTIELIETLRRIRDEGQRQMAGLEALVEASDTALLLVDKDQHVQVANPAARRVFGGYDERAAASPPSLIALTRSHELDDLVRESLASSEDLGVQIGLRGGTFRARAVRVEIGSQLCVVLALEDVSELQRLGRARRDMVANISHELRTPITSIRLLVETLARDKKIASGQAARLLHNIEVETDTLQQMAQELLDLAMIESGRAEFLLIPVEVREMVAGSVERLAEQAARKRQTIHAHIPEGVRALADIEQIKRVLGNLLHNAIKFTPEGGVISIAAEVSGPERLTLSVTDTGPGIPAEERQRVFERFYRGDRARQGGGTGLGLAIAKHIVQAHGGTIWAEDAPLAPGARICFTLPLADT
jgi:two-component system phosphate regulon sensor histidine kinase PhoR